MHLLLWLIFRQMHPNFINVRLKNSGTSDKKSSHKIKYKKIPRVHKNQKEDFPYVRYTGEKSLSLLHKTHNAF